VRVRVVDDGGVDECQPRLTLCRISPLASAFELGVDRAPRAERTERE